MRVLRADPLEGRYVRGSLCSSWLLSSLWTAALKWRKWVHTEHRRPEDAPFVQRSERQSVYCLSPRCSLVFSTEGMEKFTRNCSAERTCVLCRRSSPACSHPPTKFHLFSLCRFCINPLTDAWNCGGANKTSQKTTLLLSFYGSRCFYSE